jgi:phage-related protein
MPADKPLVWLHGDIKTPPFSRNARIEAGFLLRRVQRGESVDFPASRPMRDIGPNCHELRVNDGDITWRIAYYVDVDAIAILEVFLKKSRTTPKHVLATCKQRLRRYQQLTKEDR